MSVEAERGEALKVTAAKQREAAVTWELAVFPEVSSGVVLFPVLKEILGTQELRPSCLTPQRKVTQQAESRLSPIQRFPACGIGTTVS